MSESMWVRSHVQQLLQEWWDVCRVKVDHDGDYPFREGSAMGWVSVLPTSPPMVRVYAHAVLDVRPTAKLFRWLNQAQRSALSGRAEVDGDLVVVSQTISAEGLTGPVLGQAVSAVGTMASEIGPVIAALFDGVTPFPPRLEDVDKEAS